MGQLEPQPHGGALYRPDKGETANPNGVPKGTKHLSTWIQKLLNDPDFSFDVIDAQGNKIEYRGAPIKAIVQVAIQKALSGDDKAMEWLAKHGYGQKITLELSDPRREILDKYMGGKDAGETAETPSGPSENST